MLCSSFLFVDLAPLGVLGFQRKAATGSYCLSRSLRPLSSAFFPQSPGPAERAHNLVDYALFAAATQKTQILAAYDGNEKRADARVVGDPIELIVECLIAFYSLTFHTPESCGGIRSPLHSSTTTSDGKAHLFGDVHQELQLRGKWRNSGTVSPQVRFLECWD